MDINNFNHWFGVLDWEGKTSDEMAEFLYQNIMMKRIPNLNTGNDVSFQEQLQSFRNTSANNKTLLSLNIHHRIRELGEKHQNMISKLLDRLTSIS